VDPWVASTIKLIKAVEKHAGTLLFQVVLPSPVGTDRIELRFARDGEHSNEALLVLYAGLTPEVVESRQKALAKWFVKRDKESRR
jgi:hypothetical protein